MPIETKPATYADLAALPDHVVGELLNGVLYTTPRPRPRHGLVTTRLAGQLDPINRPPQGWIIIVEPEIRLFPETDQIAVPDVAGWRVADVPVFPADDVPLDIVPAWVCEIASPSTQRLDRTVKFPLYARAGVSWLWTIDPLERLLDAYERREQQWTLLGTFADAERVTVAPFTSVSLDLSALWL